jgi:hypothetical protein
MCFYTISYRYDCALVLVVYIYNILYKAYSLCHKWLFDSYDCTNYEAANEVVDTERRDACSLSDILL